MWIIGVVVCLLAAPRVQLPVMVLIKTVVAGADLIDRNVVQLKIFLVVCLETFHSPGEYITDYSGLFGLL